ILSPSLTLSGTAQSSTATINTLTASIAKPLLFLGLFLPVFILKRRKRLPLLCLVLLCGLASLSGCGGNHSGQTTTNNLHYTPAGTYQYIVTAASTSGQPVSSSVTLTLIVK
ncbi:MAG: hypothetical protein ABI142_13935, partial [Bryocella sp.]